MMINQALCRIQKELKAPKNQWNAFGNYPYRSCEDVTEAVKPLLLDDETITMSDEMVMIGDRYYIKATVTFYKKDASISASGYAREQEERPKFDVSQLTGSASSYARKYALNGLLMIDDVKDHDSNESQNQSNGVAKQSPTQTTQPRVTQNDGKPWFNLFDKQDKPIQQKWEIAFNYFAGGLTAQQTINKLLETYNLNVKEKQYLAGALK